MNIDSLNAARELLRNHPAPKPIEVVLAHPDDFDLIAAGINSQEHMALVPTLIHVQVEELIETISGEDVWRPIMYTMIDDGENYLMVTMSDSRWSTETRLRLYSGCAQGQFVALYKQEPIFTCRYVPYFESPSKIYEYIWPMRYGY
jgi:hypothetical protein